MEARPVAKSQFIPAAFDRKCELIGRIMQRLPRFSVAALEAFDATLVESLQVESLTTPLLRLAAPESTNPAQPPIDH